MTQQRAIELARRLLEENRNAAKQGQPAIPDLYAEAIERLIVTAELDEQTNRR